MQCPGCGLTTHIEHSDGFLYGAGDAKIGQIVGKGADEGARLKAKFLSAIPALKNLIDAVQAKFEADGFVKGLDGRRLYIGAKLDKRNPDKPSWKRSTHKALNTLLQSAGAVVMKKALVIAYDKLQAAGLKPGVDFEVVLSVHDEYQFEVSEQHAELVGETVRQSIIAAGQHFKMRCPLDGEWKMGHSWAATH